MARRVEKTESRLEYEETQKELARKLMSEHEKKMKALYDKETMKRDDEIQSINDSIADLLRKVDEKKHKHSTIYGTSCDLSRTELEQVASKDIPYTSFDFAGRYHLRNIKSKFPIPGTQIRIEKERELVISAKETLVNMKTQAIRAQKMPDVSRIAHTQSNEKQQFQRKRDMSRLEHRFEKINTMLDQNLEEVVDALEFRNKRLSTHTCSDEALARFWHFLTTGKTNRIKALVIDRVFTDINVAVAWDSKQNVIVDAAKSQDLAVTPLMFACRHMMIDVIEILLAYGAEPRIATANGDTAFHYLFKDWPERLSARSPSLFFTLRAHKVSRILKLLIDHKGDCTAQNTYGDTVLHYCAKFGLAEAATEILLKNGADGQVKNKKGLSPADAASLNRMGTLSRTLEHFHSIGKAKKDYSYQKKCHELLKTRGALSNSWSASPTDFLTTMNNDIRRAGHTRGQFINQKGEIILHPDSP